MRLVQIRDGALELRWTWLPYWLSVNPALKVEIERLMKDAVLINGLTTAESDLDMLDVFVLNQIEKKFPDIPGLKSFLSGLKLIREPA